MDDPDPAEGVNLREEGEGKSIPGGAGEPLRFAHDIEGAEANGVEGIALFPCGLSAERMRIGSAETFMISCTAVRPSMTGIMTSMMRRSGR